MHVVQTDAKIACLRQSETYPHHPGRIETMETHMSWVFLADRLVYKMKKPVRYPFLDFSTLDARRWNCQEEVRLNRRLATDVYLGVVPLVRTSQGDLVLEGHGEVVEWLVKMHRLPETMMLDKAIEYASVPDGRVVALVEKLVRFYQSRPPISMSVGNYRARLSREVDENHRVLLASGIATRGRVHRIATAQRVFLDRERGQIAQRVHAHRIVEGHGDLRPEHISLGPTLPIIDCLEFNRMLRILDSANEMAFLSMECERLHASTLGQRIFDLYRDLSNDSVSEALVAFYKSHCACLRARLAVLHARDVRSGDSGHWLVRAERYIDLAELYCAFLIPMP